MFVYLESLDDYCHSCGMISLDDDTTDMVRSSYANKSCIHVCGFHRSGCNSCSWGYHKRCLGRHVATARQDSL